MWVRRSGSRRGLQLHLEAHQLPIPLVGTSHGLGGPGSGPRQWLTSSPEAPWATAFGAEKPKFLASPRFRLRGTLAHAHCPLGKVRGLLKAGDTQLGTECLPDAQVMARWWPRVGPWSAAWPSPRGGVQGLVQHTPPSLSSGQEVHPRRSAHVKHVRSALRPGQPSVQSCLHTWEP